MRKEKSGSNGVQSAPALACGLISIGKLAIVLPMLLVYHSTIAAKADSCPVIGDEMPPIDRTSRTPALLCPSEVCKSRMASMSARETAIDFWMAQIRAFAQKRGFSAARSTLRCGMPIVNVFTSCQELIV